MKRYVILFILFAACKASVFGSHIVGGEFELLHVQDFRYRLNMILYFDRINGEPGAQDPTVTVYFYRKSDNVLVLTRTLNLVTDTQVEYSNPSCDPDNETLSTSRLLYTDVFTLPPESFSDPEGYYISWERCCRNYTITNIQSNDPLGFGISAGQTFYLEFPPVTIDGSPFVNSTPRLFPPLSDFACINKLYFTDFGGTDDDGDSLVYSLVTPNSTVDTQNAFPLTPNPGPYPEVVWRPSFGIDNIIGGNPDLTISSDGLLTVTPSNAGLYVFAVKVEEFRDGVKHGEMRRDFQMLVIADCDSNGDPLVLARETGENSLYTEGTVINFDFNDPDKCIDVLVTDSLTNIGRDSVSNVNLRAIPINFDADLEDIEIDFSQNVVIRSETDTARFTVCFPDCPFTRSGFYEIGIIGFDDACPQPSLDTIIVSLNVPPPPNENAFFRVNNVARSGIVTFSNTLEDNGMREIDIGSFDNDGDSVSLVLTPLGFEFADIGIELDEITYSDGEALTNLVWNFDCNSQDLDFSAGRDVPTSVGVTKAFDILVETEDFDQCEWEDPQQLLITLLINDPEQSKPVIFESDNPDSELLQFEYRLREVVTHTIRGFDEDKDLIKLSARGINFDFELVNFIFPEAESEERVFSNVFWELACDFDLEEQDSLRVEFLVEDIDVCQFTNQDTLTVDFLLGPPPSTRPEISFSSLNQLRIEAQDSVGFFVDTELNIQVSGLDFEGDSLELFLLNNNLPEVDFETAKGVGRVSSTLSWTPDCSVFTNGDLSEEFEFTFVLWDKNCFQPQYDTASLTIHVEDLPSKNEFAITNIITPKTSPDMNDYFGYYPVENPNENDRLIYLPTDNCAGKFEQVLIHNRWGKEVFSSTSRDFKWFGDGVASGVYYYTILYSNNKYQGALTVMY
ncbi:hypothetical protein FNH22_19540 [Fulvivirga sp. M361]|uniref:gliding motility-associated C-terminal domain-containing protein n=1 Tax=Fulvivirga sp. M361 TaxID=2594266 RepID=UPI001179C405|nr:gliding motility-associated C-terminal domain-containing protein [Fulvivirga sp. M361]TRX54311.1 hypothetical protein FNH22_19540 [Fulvivirga sp. M361]